LVPAAVSSRPGFVITGNPCFVITRAPCFVITRLVRVIQFRAVSNTKELGRPDALFARRAMTAGWGMS